MMDKYWLKTDNEAHKDKIKKDNDEILNTGLDKYWEKKNEKKEEAKPVEAAEEAKE